MIGSFSDPIMNTSAFLVLVPCITPAAASEPRCALRLSKGAAELPRPSYIMNRAEPDIPPLAHDITSVLENIESRPPPHRILQRCSAFALLAHIFQEIPSYLVHLRHGHCFGRHEASGPNELDALRQ